MPGGDRTGPAGLGPMTGRAQGYCSGNTEPGYTNPGYGRGLGRGLGRGFGRGYWGRGKGFGRMGYYPEPFYPRGPTREEEKTYLEKMVKGLEEEIKAIKERIQSITKKE
jgi:hypothetical protein